MKTIYTKSKKECYLKSEIKGYKQPNETSTAGSIIWYNQNIETLIKKYDLCVIDKKTGLAHFFIKE